MRKFPIICFVCIVLGGCQIFSKPHGAAPTNFERAISYPTLDDFGDKGGELIVAVYDSKAIPKRLRFPKADIIPENRNNASNELELGYFVKRSGLLRSRTNPLLEIGALYYFPKRFNSSVDRSGRVIQKVCGTVDGHKVDKAIIIDEPSGITGDKRKMLLDGKIDASLIKAFSGISVKAGAKYLIEFELLGARLRSINPEDGLEVRRRLLVGESCRTDYLPSIGDSPAYQLTSAYYGQLRVKQAYEIDASGGVPKMDVQLGVDAENERDSFLFFKVFLDKI